MVEQKLGVFDFPKKEYRIRYQDPVGNMAHVITKTGEDVYLAFDEVQGYFETRSFEQALKLRDIEDARKILTTNQGVTRGWGFNEVVTYVHVQTFALSSLTTFMEEQS